MTQTHKSRQEVLGSFLEKNPNDAFARYGLAMECAKTGQNDAAIENFEKLLTTNPAYVAGYFQYGQLLVRLGRIAEARKTLQSGVEAAEKAGDTHARDEISAALHSLA
jgi:tetratricopeptide (TPR) repeat protein